MGGDFILDKDGIVKFLYPSQTNTDRPSADKIIEELEVCYNLYRTKACFFFTQGNLNFENSVGKGETAFTSVFICLQRLRILALSSLSICSSVCCTSIFCE